ncbi:MAG: hypothetical protein Ct9H90mP4_02860 [Gammaproteobacteria bacterium]|nr:MAG: hypothetical protein Ct9H90mP4_02860 [Gammaproteobacteria bacterium]
MNVNDLAYEVKNIIKEASSKVMEIYSLEDVEKFLISRMAPQLLKQIMNLMR